MLDMISTLLRGALLTFPLVVAAPSNLAVRCTGTISSLADVSAAVQCTTVNIKGFTVPSGSRLNLNLIDRTTVNLQGDIQFATTSGAGPLFQIRGKSITFNGNGHTIDGGGPSYWDGKGSSGGTSKPAPMMKIAISGTFSNTIVRNSPAQAVSVGNPGPLVISSVTVDNSQGDLSNSRSNGKPAGKNTDGFDCSTTDLTIEQSIIRNQDDCIAINKGSGITFKNNHCSGGHGISIGSVGSSVAVSDIVISGNIITNSDQALRIKTIQSSKGSTVKNITYSGNTSSGIRRFGVIIDQSYPSTISTPGTGVQISQVNFVGATNTISVDSSATPIAINCGSGACKGTWEWTSLQTSGGVADFVHNSPSIQGFTL